MTDADARLWIHGAGRAAYVLVSDRLPERLYTGLRVSTCVCDCACDHNINTDFHGRYEHRRNEPPVSTQLSEGLAEASTI